MATKLYEILQFNGLVVGVPTSLPHGLNFGDTPQTPDRIDAQTGGFTITADNTNVTVTRGVAALDNVLVWVEVLHTEQRAFGASTITGLTPRPFVLQPGVGGAGAGNTLDQAYDEGGPGVGRAILADSGSVTVTNNEDDATAALELFRAPVVGGAGDALAITMGANATGAGLRLTNDGIGQTIAAFKNGIGTTSDAAGAIELANTTAGAPAAVQHSPMAIFTGHGHDGGGDREYQFALQTQPVDASVEAQFHFLYATGGGSFGSLAWFDQTGQLVFDAGANSPGIQSGTVDPSAGGGVPAEEGSLYMRYVGTAGSAWIKTGIADTAWALINTGAIAGNTLDQAYDQGGVGVGRFITADSGAVTITNAVDDATAALDIFRTPAVGGAGDGVSITMGANATGAALRAINTGTGETVQARADGLGTASGLTGAVEMTNESAAGVGTPQYSPMLILTGHGHDSVDDHEYQYALQTQPIDGDATSQLHFLYAHDGGAFNSLAWFDQDGQLVFDAGANSPGIQSGTVDPSAGGGIPAEEGSLYMRYVGAAGTAWIKTGIADTAWTLISTSTFAGNTLDQAYDQGGAGAGRSITADSGAVTIANNENDVTAALEIYRAPTVGGAGDAFYVATGANSTGIAVRIDTGGTGRSLYVGALGIGAVSNETGAADLINTAISGVGAPEFSPMLILTGHGHDGVDDHEYQYALQTQPIDAGATSQLHFLYAHDGGAFSSLAWFDQDGQLVFDAGANSPGIQSGTVDPSAGGGVPAEEGSLYMRYVGAAGTAWIKTGIADTAWTLISTSTFAGNTLDQAYDQGGAGAGRSITADSGAVAITNSVVDATNALEVTRSGVAATGHAISVIAGGSITGHGLNVSVTSTGASGINDRYRSKSWCSKRSGWGTGHTRGQCQLHRGRSTGTRQRCWVRARAQPHQ